MPEGVSVLFFLLMITSGLVLATAPASVQAEPPLVRDEYEWGTDVLDHVGNVGLYNSLAVDDDGTLHAVYYGATNNDLKFANNTGGYWSSYTVDTVGEVGMRASLVLDSNGDPHIMYIDESDPEHFRVKCATYSPWNREVVSSGGSVISASSLVVDNAGNVHMVYVEDDNLVYANNVGGSWTRLVLDQIGGGR